MEYAVKNVEWRALWSIFSGMFQCYCNIETPLGTMSSPSYYHGEEDGLSKRTWIPVLRWDRDEGGTLQEHKGRFFPQKMTVRMLD